MQDVDVVFDQGQRHLATLGRILEGLGVGPADGDTVIRGVGALIESNQVAIDDVHVVTADESDLVRLGHETCGDAGQIGRLILEEEELLHVRQVLADARIDDHEVDIRKLWRDDLDGVDHGWEGGDHDRDAGAGDLTNRLLVGCGIVELDDLRVLVPQALRP